MPVSAGIRSPGIVSGALPGDRGEDELVAVGDQDRDRPGAEHGARGLGQGVEHHAATSTFVAVR